MIGGSDGGLVVVEVTAAVVPDDKPVVVLVPVVLVSVEVAREFDAVVNR